MTRTRALIGCVIALVALTFADVAISKEIRTTVCGRHQCRTVARGISGIATLPGRVAAPRKGRFYTVSSNMDSAGWRVVYERTAPDCSRRRPSGKLVSRTRVAAAHRGDAPSVHSGSSRS